VNLKKIVAPIVGLVVAGLLGACTPAEVASSNISQDSDNFKIMRRITFVNGITDKYLLTIEGLCSIKADSADKQIEVTCKTDEGKYKKHYLGLSDNVTYVVEQVEASETDTYHYKVVYRPETLVPDIEMQTSSSSRSGS
jgi:hypothetical protein